MRIRNLAACSLLALAAAACGSSDPNCTTEDRSAWMSEDAMKARVTEMGYKTDVFKVAGNCYEIYGTDKEGRPVEVYFNPVTGDIVKSEIEA